MKAWMKILMWFGLGGGIGFFAGYQIGARTREKEEPAINEMPEEDFDYQYNSELVKYRGGDYDGDDVVVVEDDDAEMPEEIPEIPEPFADEIPQMHPQDLIPVQITESEYYANPDNFEQAEMLYYEDDQVLVSKDTPTKPIKTKQEMDEIIGIGMIFNFYPANKEPIDTIFVKNETMGVLFRIDRLDEAYETQEYEPEEDDFTAADLEDGDE